MTSATLRGVLVALCAASTTVVASDWPAWRGPNATSTTAETKLPISWSATENIAWKAPIAGLGVSSPIVAGGRVFVTSQLGSGTRRAGNHPRLVQGADATAAGERALGQGGAARGTVFIRGHSAMSAIMTVHLTM
jgi:hypothetical protein